MSSSAFSASEASFCAQHSRHELNDVVDNASSARSNKQNALRFKKRNLLGKLVEQSECVVFALSFPVYLFEATARDSVCE